jgi:uncharacterized membrane protein YcaP (DUF421 family)
MQQGQIHVFDAHRLLVGQVSWAFLAELFVRGVLIYVILVAAIRLMGKRVAGQLSITELAVIVTLGAAVGVPMQAPERGILPALVILGVALAFQCGANFWAFKDARIELLTQGDLICLVRDGRMCLKPMGQVGVPRERLSAALRGQGIEQLGQVRRVYLEGGGQWSVYKVPESRPGLTIVPESDEPFRQQQAKIPGWYACASCGHVQEQPQKPEKDCPYCGSPHWAEAVTEASQRTPAGQQA